MSSNGVFSTTLDFELFTAGYVTLNGYVSGTIGPSLDSAGGVLILGEIQPQTLDFTFDSFGQMPGIFGQFSGSIDFSGSATAEIGITRFGTANNRIDFTFGTIEGYNLTHGYVDTSIGFTFTGRLAQFMDADTTGTISFVLSSKGVNVSAHRYSKVGVNGVRIDYDDFNDVIILNKQNEVDTVDDGSRYVKVLQY